ncbi:hypothetical protein JAAARDRAFT_197562 [Jaapia argillacea MUCL 33604]|uniref:Uncharacterized protein n=1 Tax=Jaapia argillacea MUCL 33604 TaxID=933084 RepID=A0A067PHX4_9AGAM|nr:hypothetical protein JAAARDRAFT_197562 [Jaapia argillacea MUCL 33604]
MVKITPYQQHSEQRLQICRGLKNPDVMAPPGLPINCYNKDWLKTLSPHKRHHLRPLKKHYKFKTPTDDRIGGQSSSSKAAPDGKPARPVKTKGHHQQKPDQVTSSTEREDFSQQLAGFDNGDNGDDKEDKED